MRRVWILSAGLLLVGAVATASAQSEGSLLVVTSSNRATNELLVYDGAGTLLQVVPTQGQGGVSENAGGLAVRERTIAVVNFGSASVSVLERTAGGFAVTAVIPSASSPVSVAFGKDHLYVLGTTTVESHRITGGRVESASDGLAALAVGDGSAAQVGVVDDALVITEKSNVVETVGLRSGAIIGAVTPVGLPSGSDTPFGLVTRGANAYVTIAHSDEVALIRGEQVVAAALTGTPGGSGQHSPCWVAIAGPYLFTSNSPSRSVSRLVATGATILLDDPVAAQTVGAPIDIAVVDKRLAVLDTGAGVTRVTQFTVGDDGALTPVAVSTIQASANGVGIVRN